MGAVPDVIALQEVIARVWCPDNHNFILDDEPLYKLIRELQFGTGVRYRIAYFQIFTRERRVGGFIVARRADRGVSRQLGPGDPL